MRAALLEPMPPFEKDPSSASQSSTSMQDLSHAVTNGVSTSDDLLLGNFGSPTKTDVGSSLLDIIGTSGSSQTSKADKAKADNLLDLLEGLDFGSGPATTIPPSSALNNSVALNSLFAATSPPPMTSSASPNNILEGLMSMNTQPVTAPVNNLDDIFGDLGGSLTSAPMAVAPMMAPTMTVFDKDEFRITFDFEKSGVPNQIVIKLRATNVSAICSVTDFVVQAAVPKSMQLELAPPSATTIAVGGGLVTQVLKVNNPSHATVKMRLKISYSRNGLPHQDQMEVSNFPASILQ